ncbi:MAG: 2-phospho-L-lactate guanylyltransferase [Betaproteobacteria bacterium]|nr:2-phospho-L-lactate guanylyltransferase [Betaproteobacteria bacterium]
MTSEIWTIVPMHGIERGKSRLAAAIGAAGRARLNRWLLVRTLKVIERWCGDLKHCVVVSPCDQALELAQRAGAAVVREMKDANDLNGALALGVLYATANGADKVLVLSCDLPDLTAESLRAFTRTAGHPQEMVLAPDKAGTGTNALLVDARRDVEFRFGEESLAQHREWAAARGWQVSVIARPELGFDLDTPDDLTTWLKRGVKDLRKLDLNQF